MEAWLFFLCYPFDLIQICVLTFVHVSVKNCNKFRQSSFIRVNHLHHIIHKEVHNKLLSWISLECLYQYIYMYILCVCIEIKRHEKQNQPAKVLINNDNNSINYKVLIQFFHCRTWYTKAVCKWRTCVCVCVCVRAIASPSAISNYVIYV